MSYIVCCLLALSASTAAADDLPGPLALLFVLNKSDANVYAIDPETGGKVFEVAVGVGPHEAATSPDGRTVVVCNYGERQPGSTLSLIDVARRTVRRTIELGDYHRPHGVKFLPGGKKVVITAEVEKKLLIVDLESGTVEAAIDTDQGASHMVAITPDGARAFVANIQSGSVSVIDLVERKRIGIIPTGAGCEGIAVHPSGRQVWTTNRAADTVSVIDATSLEIVATLPCKAFPIRVAMTPNGNHALVSGARSGDLVVFDAHERVELRRIPMTEKIVEGDEAQGRMFGDFGTSPVPIGILIRPDGRFAYIANTNADIVTVVDLESWKIVRRLPTGKQPDGLAWWSRVEKDL